MESLSELAAKLWPYIARLIQAPSTAAEAGGDWSGDHGELSGLADDDHTQYLPWNRAIGGSIGHVKAWEYDGVDGTAREVIANGTGDVVYGLGGMFVVRASDGGIKTAALSPTPIAPSGTSDIYSVGGDVLTLAVAADGSATVQRTAGALTYKVALLLIWL